MPYPQAARAAGRIDWPIFGPVHAGDPFVLRYLTVDDTEAPMDLTGAVVRWTFRYWQGTSRGGRIGDEILAKSLLTGGIVLIDPMAGQAEVRIAAGEVPGYLSGYFYCEFEAAMPTGDVATTKHLLLVSPSALNQV